MSTPMIITSLCLRIFTTVPDSLCLIVLKKLADLFAEFLLIFLQILQVFRDLGPSGTRPLGPVGAQGPKKLQNLWKNQQTF